MPDGTELWINKNFIQMQYVKIVFALTADNDVLMALLSDAGYEGFEEAGPELLAYIKEADFDADQLKAIAEMQGANYRVEIIPAQNWNALWESNFSPVIVADFCTIRAHFHDLKVTTPYEIIITPKMSFGTGHHATTQLMMTMMKDYPFAGKSVLDFGTGTGVLAILAEKLGAANILAIDNDQWSVDNALENIERNDCKKTEVSIGSLEDVHVQTDVILANINRHILLQYMHELFDRLNAGGTLFMSGLLLEDEDIITHAATNESFHFLSKAVQNGWIALRFEKIRI
jgi:ribosomal protein L11 methyltransferase